MCVCVCVCMYKRIHGQRQYNNTTTTTTTNWMPFLFSSFLLLLRFFAVHFLCLYLFLLPLCAAVCCCCCCRQSNWRVWKFLLYLFYSICCCTHWTFEVFFSFLYLRVVNYLTCFSHPMERFTRTKTSGVVASPFVLCKFLWDFFYLTAWPYIFWFSRGSLL